VTSVGQQLLEQLGLILKAYGDCKRQSKYDHQSKYDDLSDIDDAKIVELITRSTVLLSARADQLLSMLGKFRTSWLVMLMTLSK